MLPFRYDPGELGPQEVDIAITHCGICHSDLHLISNDWGISQYPFIPGHEIVGAVAAVGDLVRSLEVGQRVGLGWQSNSCGECEWCMRGLENLCPAAEGTCVHRNGGYADSVRANARFVIPIPEALDSEQAAPLLCAGITVYNPLRTHGVNPSSRVGIVGMGAHNFVNSRESKALKEVAGTQDFILSTANADQDWGTYVQALRPTGTLCFVGVPPSPVAVHAFPLISGLRSISGNPTGSPYRLREMLDVAARHGVKAQTESFPMAKANEAIEKVKKNKVRYRAVLAN